MRAAFFNGPKDIEVADRPDPVVVAPTDAVVRVVLSCVCGSDLWYYRGESDHPVGSIGHEFIGVVEQVGDAVGGLAIGDLVIAPFIYSDGTCPHCQAGVTLSCVAGGTFGDGVIDGGQGEAVRVPLAGSTLVKAPGSGYSDETLRSLLTLSDVMSTGHHAAVSARVQPGHTIAAGPSRHPAPDPSPRGELMHKRTLGTSGLEARIPSLRRSAQAPDHKIDHYQRLVNEQEGSTQP